VTRLLVEMLEPFERRVLDPACGSRGLFVQSAEFVEAHGGRARQISGSARRTTTSRIPSGARSRLIRSTELRS
jgi:type I restriction enzyme M protein